MQAASVTHDPAFQTRVNQAKETIGEIPVTQLILDREAETKAKLIIALENESPDFEPFVRLIALRSSVDQGVFVSTAGLTNAIDAAWLLIKEFFPLDTYGLPSLGMWAWLMRCLLGETVQEPTPEDFPVFLTYDFENILAMAKLNALSQYCRENGLDLDEFEQRYQTVEDRIIELLDPRWFIEMIPGTDLKKQVDHLRSVITDAYDAGGIDLEANKIPNNFVNKLEYIFVPRQFQGASLEDIQGAHPDEKEISNISREYKEIVDKTAYQRVDPKPRGLGRPH